MKNPNAFLKRFRGDSINSLQKVCWGIRMQKLTIFSLLRPSSETNVSATLLTNLLCQFVQLITSSWEKKRIVAGWKKNTQSTVAVVTSNTFHSLFKFQELTTVFFCNSKWLCLKIRTLKIHWSCLTFSIPILVSFNITLQTPSLFRIPGANPRMITTINHDLVLLQRLLEFGTHQEKTSTKTTGLFQAPGFTSFHQDNYRSAWIKALQVNEVEENEENLMMDHLGP